MIERPIVNLVYDRVDKSKIDIMFNDGNVIKYSIAQLEFPYFYSSEDFTISKRIKEDDRAEVISCQPVVKKTLTHNGYVDYRFYKVTTKTPITIGRLRSKSAYSAEGNIPYLDRRLGADGIVTFAEKLENYAYIDIEEQKGVITLIGEIDINEPEKYYSFSNVTEMLKHFIDKKITAIMAWNGDGYDFQRIEAEVMKLHDAGYVNRWNVTLKIDAMVFYSKYMQKKLMSLNAAAKEEEVGQKLELSKSFDDVSMDELKTYNEQDVRLLMKVMEQTMVHQVAMKLANMTGLIPISISATRMVDNLMLRKFNGEVVLFDYEPAMKKPYKGAEIITPVSGVHENVASIDIDHLYPSIIMYNDWQGLDKDVWELVKQFISMFIGIRDKEKSLFKSTNDVSHDVAQKAYKVSSNSIYGVFANEYYRFCNVDIADFITSLGRKVRQTLHDIIEKYGYKVISSDTDSVFVANVPKHLIEKFVEIINRNLYPYKVKLEKYFVKMIALKSGTGQSVKKRYVGLTESGELKVTGAEMIRSDATVLTKEVEEEILLKILKENVDDNYVIAYFKKLKEDFKNTPIEKLLYEKVVDADKEYKSKTRIVKVAEKAGYKVETHTESFTNKNSVTRDRVVYKIKPKGVEKLFELNWVLGEKGEPVLIEEGKDLSEYADKIDYNVYWEKSIRAPLNRILLSVGFTLIEKEKIIRTKRRTYMNETDLEKIRKIVQEK